jgi:hypothetical protein
MSESERNLSLKQFARSGARALAPALPAILTCCSLASAQNGWQQNGNERGDFVKWVTAWQGSPTAGGTFSSSSCPSDVGSTTRQ